MVYLVLLTWWNRFNYLINVLFTFWNENRKYFLLDCEGKFLLLFTSVTISCLNYFAMRDNVVCQFTCSLNWNLFINRCIWQTYYKNETYIVIYYSVVGYHTNSKDDSNRRKINKIQEKWIETTSSTHFWFVVSVFKYETFFDLFHS